MKSAGHVARVAEIINSYKVVILESEGIETMTGLEYIFIDEPFRKALEISFQKPVSFFHRI
jgi:hypothetical protein